MPTSGWDDSRILMKYLLAYAPVPCIRVWFGSIIVNFPIGNIYDQLGFEK